MPRIEREALLPGELDLRDTSVYFVDSFDRPDHDPGDSYRGVLDFKRWLSESRGRTVLAVDTETTGLDMYNPRFRIRLAQFGDENTAWTINAEKWPGLAREVMENYRDTPFVLHNISYDAQAMMSQWPGFRFPWEYSHDTMLYHRIHDNEAPAGLKRLSRLYFGQLAVQSQGALDDAFMNFGWDWATVPMTVEAYTLYAAVDCILTARMYRRLEHIAQSYIGKLEMDTARIATQMMYHGMVVDRDYCIEKLGDFEVWLEQMDAWLRTNIGGNPNSNKQLAKYFQGCGVTFNEFTPTGQPKLDKEVLTFLANAGYSVAEKILQMRKISKLANTYFKNLLSASDNPSATIHPSINTMAARTSRMSVTAPALQTLPKGDSLVRGAFIPESGNVIVSADFSQIELRLTGQIAKDEALIDAFRRCDATGEDLFTEIGRDIYDPSFQRKDKRRTLIKNTIYGSSYGAGIPKMAHSAGVPIADMEAVASALFARFPAIKRIQRLAIGLAERRLLEEGRPSITNLYGRKLYIDPDVMYTAANYMIQSTAADELKRALQRIDYAGLGQYMMLPIHDEVLLSVPKEDAEEAMKLLGEAMTITSENSGGFYTLPIPADPEGPLERWKAK